MRGWMLELIGLGGFPKACTGTVASVLVFAELGGAPLASLVVKQQPGAR